MGLHIKRCTTIIFHDFTHNFCLKRACPGTVLEPGQILGSRVPGTIELPGSGTGNRGKPRPYCYWYWYCNLSWANIGIDIVIGKHTLSVLILVLLLQDTYNKYCLPYWYCKTISQVLRKELHQKFHYLLKTMIIYKCKMPLKAIQKFLKWPEIALRVSFLC